MKKYILSALFSFAFSNITYAYTADDVFSFKRVGNVAASPDGNEVAFTIMEVKTVGKKKKWQSSIYVKDNAGKTTLFTPDNLQASMPVWSPDGKEIAFLVKDKSAQIWRANLSDHTTKKWLEFNDIAAFKWAPDGNSLAFVGTEKNNSSDAAPVNVAKNYVNARIYRVAKDSDKPSVLSPDNVSIAAIFPGALDAGFDFSPDGKSIVYSYQKNSEARYSDSGKLAILNLSNHAVTLVTWRDQANQPIYSPDGKWIAFHSHPGDPAKMANNSVIYGETCLIKTANLSIHCLANTPDENPMIVGWNQDSQHLTVLDFYKTAGFVLYTLNIDPTIPAKEFSTTIGYLDPLSLTLNQNHSILGFSWQTVKNPPEAFVSGTDQFNLTQISHVQSSSQKNLGDVKVVHWKSTDNLSIEGLLITPANYNPKKKYPVVVMVHGGPAGAWNKRYLGGCEEYGESFVPGCFSNLTSKGFILFQPNPRGSAGYGKTFRMANYKDFGGGDYRDIMSGVDYLIQNNIADPKRLAIFGWSYGGYMTAWAITQTHRFKAAIDGDGLTDFISFSGTTDIPFYLTQYLGSTFWDNKKLYLERSPISFVKNITTPLLILHGKNDNRVPLSQAQELYSALNLQDKPVKMFVAPNTEHVPENANIIYQNIQEIQDWLVNQVLKGDKTAIKDN